MRGGPWRTVIVRGLFSAALMALLRVPVVEAGEGEWREV
jgi:hypothetical protein